MIGSLHFSWDFLACFPNAWIKPLPSYLKQPKLKIMSRKKRKGKRIHSILLGYLQVNLSHVSVTKIVYIHEKKNVIEASCIAERSDMT